VTDQGGCVNFPDRLSAIVFSGLLGVKPQLALTRRGRLAILWPLVPGVTGGWGRTRGGRKGREQLCVGRDQRSRLCVGRDFVWGGVLCGARPTVAALCGVQPTLAALCGTRLCVGRGFVWGATNGRGFVWDATNGRGFVWDAVLSTAGEPPLRVDREVPSPSHMEVLSWTANEAC